MDPLVRNTSRTLAQFQQRKEAVPGLGELTSPPHLRLVDDSKCEPDENSEQTDGAHNGSANGTHNAAVNGVKQETFHECITAADRQEFINIRDSLPADMLCFLTLYSRTVYDGLNARLFLSENKNAGFGLITTSNGTELVSVFSLPKTQLGAEIVRNAVQLGADHLDCLNVDGKLVSLYARFGFVIERTVEWKDEFAPPDWSYARWGRPSDVHMVRRPESLETLQMKPRVANGDSAHD